MERIKTYNSSLHNVSKKRLEQIKNGTLEKKTRKPIRKQSKKSASLWAKAREDCFKIYGKKCYLCGATDCEIHVHHWQKTRQQAPELKYDMSNLIPLCANCHNHNGADKRFYDLKCEINTKMQRQLYESLYDD